MRVSEELQQILQIRTVELLQVTREYGKASLPGCRALRKQYAGVSRALNQGQSMTSTYKTVSLESEVQKGIMGASAALEHAMRGGKKY